MGPGRASRGRGGGARGGCKEAKGARASARRRGWNAAGAGASARPPAPAGGPGYRQRRGARRRPASGSAGEPPGLGERVARSARSRGGAAARAAAVRIVLKRWWGPAAALWWARGALIQTRVAVVPRVARGQSPRG